MNDETMTNDPPRKRRDFLDIKNAQVEVAEPTQLRVEEAPPNGLAPEDGLVPITVRLAPRHFEYVRQVGALRGHSPERALETIVREHKQRDLSLIATGPGMAVPPR